MDNAMKMIHYVGRGGGGVGGPRLLLLGLGVVAGLVSVDTSCRRRSSKHQHFNGLGEGGLVGLTPADYRTFIGR